MIEIANRLRPFSHQPGIACLLPCSGVTVRCYPTRLIFDHREEELPYETRVEGFTVVQDLERECLTVFHRQLTCHILPDQKIYFGKHPPHSTWTGPRYDFGFSKKLEMERLYKYGDMRAVIPLWIRLGSRLSLSPLEIDGQGPFALLEHCKQLIDACQHDLLISRFRDLFKVGFEGMMVPRAHDTEYQGILPKEIQASTSNPLFLLQKGAQLLRSLFLSTEGCDVSILPHLPPDLFSGRIIQEVYAGGRISLEWQKKQIRRIELFPNQSGEIRLHLPSYVRSYRIRARGERFAQRMDRESVLVLSEDIPYLLDQFIH